jgi:Holliday junction DNA helicase RuvA
VSGIGPKVALAVVSSAPPAELRRAIALDDPARFQAIPGIGKKTAERIVLELKGSIASAIEPNGGAATASGLVERDALVELGYSLVEAEQALAGVSLDLSPEERVREALRSAA